MPFRWEGRLVIGGKITWVHIESRPRPAANGDMIWTGILYDITNRKQTERFLSFIAEEGWSGSQGDFFARLVEYIGRALGVDYVLIGRRKDDQTVQTTGLYARGRIVPDMEYSTRGAPCQNVIGKILCHHSDHLQEMFPEDSLVAEMGAQSYLAIPLTDSSGKPLGLMAVLDTKPMPDAQLVTAFLQIAAVRVAGEIERRAKVDELHWKTALMEAQMEAAPDGILMIDNQGRRILQNQRMNDLLKIPPHISGDEDDRVQFSFVASRAKDPAKMKDKVAYLDAHPEEISRDELEFVDGTIVDRYSSPVRDKLGRSCGRIWTFRDITQARQLEMQLRQSQKMEGIGQLAGGVAHDFNNILAAMLMQTDLMGMVEQLPGEVVEGLQQIRADANRAADLTRQLLLFSRRQVMQASVFDLNELVTSLAKMLQRIIGEDIRLQLHLHAAPLWMRADAGMIDQIIMNLAVNARDAMSTGGRLEIETAQKHVTGELAGLYPDAAPGDYACLSVSDTGGGIPLDILPRIFEPFFTTKAPGKGTGLGLATVFGIVKQHHGWIKVDNRHGLGVTFQIFLPTSSEGSTQASKVEARAKSIGGKETILLVEDEPAVRRLISSLLERHGYQVVAASNGVEAVDLWLAQSRKVALLLTDLVMPGGMTGHELARQLQSRQSNLKIVFMSGYSPEIAGREFELRQGENFVQKPFAADRLLETIRQSLDV
jgi:signal transduction histidine kinase/ActR/RegA family two-component response regulator